MPVPPSQDRVMRLVEMIVEEVSIVDRAANKHRFLIVKRSEEMDDTTTGADPTETDLNASGDPGDGSGEATPPDTGDGSADGDPHSDDSNGPLATTVAALEGLTEAVELLAAQDGETAVPRLAELAGELLTAAETLAAAARSQDDGSAGNASTTTTAGAQSTASAADTADPGHPADTAHVTGEAGGTPAAKPGTDDATSPNAGPDRLSATVTAIRAALQQVNATLAPQAPSPTAKAAPDGASGAASGGASGGTPAQIAEQLALVVRALQTLTGSVKEQQQRLARLEKRSGLPNSQPGGEHAPAAGPPAGSWPLDLNQPVDRESVDKSVSFHDPSA